MGMGHLDDLFRQFSFRRAPYIYNVMYPVSEFVFVRTPIA